MFHSEMSSFQGHFIKLRLVDKSDASFIIKIRAAPIKAGFLSEIQNSESSQKKWIEDYKTREKGGIEYYYIILTKKDEPCGTVRLYDIANQSGIFGSWVLGTNKPRMAALESAVGVFSLAFNILKLSSCEIRAKKTNTHAISFYKRLGAVQYNEQLDQVFLNYKKETFIENLCNYQEAITCAAAIL